LYVFLGMDHYLVLKKKEILQYRATWMNINWNNPVNKDKCCLIQVIWGI
jgi:hypothetical protein